MVLLEGLAFWGMLLAYLEAQRGRYKTSQAQETVVNNRH